MRKNIVSPLIAGAVCVLLGITGPASAEDAIELDPGTLASAEADLAAAEKALLGEIAGAEPAVPKKTAAVKKEEPVKKARNLKDTKFEKASTPAPQPVKKAAEARTPRNDSPAPVRKVSSRESSDQGDYQRKIQDLNRKLQQARNSLMVSEMEVERLSSIIEERNRIALGSSGARPVAHTPISSAVESVPARAAALRAPVNNLRTSQKATNDMQIATIVVDKANLRTGPGLKNSPLMSVGKGTRLAVEHRIGEWYRVIAPTGTRAWVSSEVVSFGKESKSSPTRTVKIQGYKDIDDDAAFQFIKDSAQ